MTTAAPYPVTLEVEYPHKLSRLSTLFRIFLYVPVFTFIWLAIGSPTISSFFAPFGGPFRGGFLRIFVPVGGVGGAIWAAIIVRQYIPHWLFDFQVALMRFEVRAAGYVSLLTDRFPTFEGEYPINFNVVYPDRLNPWKVLIWKVITSIPHLIILAFLGAATVLVVVIAWFAILFMGSYPRGLHDFVAGVLRWQFRVQGYILSLTDEYPPFSLK